jgi:hypothetical protein
LIFCHQAKVNREANLIEYQ